MSEGSYRYLESQGLEDLAVQNMEWVENLFETAPGFAHQHTPTRADSPRDRSSSHVGETPWAGGNSDEELEISNEVKVKFEDYSPSTPRGLDLQMAYEQKQGQELRALLEDFDRRVFADSVEPQPQAGIPSQVEGRAQRIRPDRQTTRPVEVQVAEWAAAFPHLRVCGRKVSASFPRVSHSKPHKKCA
ncbi:hypothetical protein CYMTET_35472 [Cymbomonas tetramitiformis]|uniref:Uncharacterized protein n=1 Tax=Cymbomonas tetramitiformis TaxID=36881 RepID=A0AAE0F939_9CHLO|nr:hypothetical protein CYMTET_35472 [Cymbomonas tetramitiformis]